MEEHKIVCKIHYLEDKLLRSNNSYEIDELRKSLYALRRSLSRLKWTSSRG